MEYKLTRYEQETIIRYSEDPTDTPTLYTCSRSMINKLDTLCKKQPDNFRVIHNDSCSKTYEIPRKSINIKGLRVKRELTEEQKLKLLERINKSKTA